MTHLTDELEHALDPVQAGRVPGQHGAGGTGRGRLATGFGTVAGRPRRHDGALDLAVVNGRVARDLVGARAAGGSFWTHYTERNQLFANEGTGRFRDISEENVPFCGTGAVGRGLAWGDYNGDGAIDLLVTSIGGRARLYRNAVPNRGHWLLVRALDPTCGGRDAYGAEVSVRAGPRRWLGLVNPADRATSVAGTPASISVSEVSRPTACRRAIQVVLMAGRHGGDLLGAAADQLVVLKKGAGEPTAGRPAP